MSERDPLLPVVAEDFSDGVNFFATLGKTFAGYLIQYEYDYDTARQLVSLLGLAAHTAIQESLFPNNGEQFRDEKGRVCINEVPDASLIIHHKFQEFGKNYLQIKHFGEEALEEIMPIECGGTQGRFIISGDDNSHCAGAVIPCGFYDAYDHENQVMVVDGDGDSYSSYGEMTESKGQW